MDDTNANDSNFLLSRLDLNAMHFWLRNRQPSYSYATAADDMSLKKTASNQ